MTVSFPSDFVIINFAEEGLDMTANNAPSIAVYGSGATGVVYTNDPAQLQSLIYNGKSVFKEGLASAVFNIDGQRVPSVQDLNAVFRVVYQAVQNQQVMTILPYNPTRIYSIGSIVQYNSGQLYVSLQNNNVNHTPSLTDSTPFWQFGLTDVGVVPNLNSTIKSDLVSAFNQKNAQGNVYLTTGTGSAFVVSTGTSLFPSLNGNMNFIIKAHTSCLANATITIDGNAPIPIYNKFGQPVAPNDINVGQEIFLVIDYTTNAPNRVASITNFGIGKRQPQNSGIFSVADTPFNTTTTPLTISTSGLVITYSKFAYYFQNTRSAGVFSAGTYTLPAGVLPTGTNSNPIFLYLIQSGTAPNFTYSLQAFNALQTGADIVYLGSFTTATSANGGIISTLTNIAPWNSCTNQRNPIYNLNGGGATTISGSTTLNLATSTGNATGEGIGYSNDDYNSDYVSVAGSNNAPVGIYIRGANYSAFTSVLVLPKSYDNGGTAPTALGGPQFGIYAIYRFIKSNALIAIQGNAAYTSFINALAALQNSNSYTATVARQSFVLCGYAIITGGANTTWGNSSGSTGNYFLPLSSGAGGSSPSIPSHDSLVGISAVDLTGATTSAPYYHTNLSTLQQIGTSKNAIGTLSNLTTPVKTDLVSAVNSIYPSNIGLPIPKEKAESYNTANGAGRITSTYAPLSNNGNITLAKNVLYMENANYTSTPLPLPAINNTYPDGTWVGYNNSAQLAGSVAFTRSDQTANITLPTGGGYYRSGNTYWFRYSSLKNLWVYLGYFDSTVSANSSIITNRGDLIIGDVNGADSRLAIGSSGQILTSDGTTASWITNPTFITPASDIIPQVVFTPSNGTSVVQQSFIQTGRKVDFSLIVDNLSAGNWDLTSVIGNFNRNILNGGGFVNANSNRIVNPVRKTFENGGSTFYAFINSNSNLIGINNFGSTVIPLYPNYINAGNRVYYEGTLYFN